MDCVRGVSPHTRGNLWAASSDCSRAGRIPAHTGEPGPDGRDRHARKAYPRTHGGTRISWDISLLAWGVSPHTRGNHGGAAVGRCDQGRIPAHTGEPAGLDASAAGSGAYPRTHGGTSVGRIVARKRMGVSPHTRGNRAARSGRGRPAGRIPAHTGEPRPRPGMHSWSGAYPRTHGGTRTSSGCRQMDAGVSPHTRGNQALA